MHEEALTNTQIIVLAGGKGTRMHTAIPKVLMPFQGSTLVGYLIEHAIIPLKPTHKPIVVIGYEGNQVKETLGDKFIYALQEEQLGTGHAVISALDSIDPHVSQVVVLYGDMPLVRPETLTELARIQHATSSPMTMLTITVPDYDDWRVGCYGWGRIIRNADNEIEEVVEKKDASEDQLQIKEVTSAHFAFDVDWLRNNIEKLSNTNASGEYYLTALPEIACNQGHVIQSVAGDPREVIGANTLEEFQFLQANI